MKILSLDGGGIRGTITARILENLENKTPFLNKVDLYSGTSTGGILALGLASGLTPTKCLEFYTKYSKNIFTNRNLLDSLTPDEYFRANYGQEGLKEALTEIFGNKKLKDLKKQVLIPALDLRLWKPKYFDNKHDGNTNIVDVALATSSAPTYFPAHGWETNKITTCFADGGLFANNPSDSAIAYAQANKHSIQHIKLISIGTGNTSPPTPEDILDGEIQLDWGFRQWIVKPPHYLLTALFDATALASTYRTKQLLGNNTIRIQPTLPKVIDLDDIESVPELIKLADQYELETETQWINNIWNKQILS